MIDLATGAAEYELEGETPTALARDLEPARKQLKELIKEMNSFKGWSDPLNPDAQPFLDAFSAARAKALLAADRYAKAARSFTPPARTSVAQTRKLVADFVGDMDALKPWAWASTGSASFDAAFSAARSQAKILAARYATQMK